MTFCGKTPMNLPPPSPTTALTTRGFLSSSIDADHFPDADTLSLFVTWRLNTVKNVLPLLSGLAHHLKPLMGAEEWEAVRSSHQVRRAIRGGQKLGARPPRQAPPLPLKTLRRACADAMSDDISYDRLMWSAMAVVLFFCCGRAAETTNADRPRFRNEQKTMMRETTTCDSAGFRSFLPYHKASPLYAGSYYYFVAADSGEELMAVVRKYIEVRDLLFGQAGPLWMRSDGSIPTRRWTVDILKSRCGRKFTGHSFRPGGATWYVLAGADDSTVKRLGRWTSSSWESYI